MPTYNKNILTNAGSRLLSRVDGGADQIKFSKVVFSSEDLKSLNDDQIKALTSINPIELSAVPQVYLNDNTGETNIRSYVSNENSAQGLYVSTYAVFAKDSNDREILFSVECSDTPDYLIPNPDGSHPSGLLYNLKINVSDTNNVVFTSDTQVYATKNELENLNRVALKFKGVIPDGTDVRDLESGTYIVSWISKDIKNLPVPQPCWGEVRVNRNDGAILINAHLAGQEFWSEYSGSPSKWGEWQRIVQSDDLVNLDNKSLATNDLTVNHQLKTSINEFGDQLFLDSIAFEQRLNKGKRVNRLDWNGIHTDSDLNVKGEIKGPTIDEINKQLNSSLKFKGVIPDGTDVRDLESGTYIISWISKDIKNLPAPQPCWGEIRVDKTDGPMLINAHVNGQEFWSEYSGSPSKWGEWQRIVQSDDLVDAINNEVKRADDTYVTKSSRDRPWKQYELNLNNDERFFWSFIKNEIIYLQEMFKITDEDVKNYTDNSVLTKNGMAISGLEGLNIDAKFVVFSLDNTNHNCRFRIKNGYLIADWLQTGTYDFGGISLPIA